MTDPSTSQAERENVRRSHVRQERAPGEGPAYCATCGPWAEWPCPTDRILADLEKAEAKLEASEERERFLRERVENIIDDLRRAERERDEARKERDEFWGGYQGALRVCKERNEQGAKDAQTIEKLRERRASLEESLSAGVARAEKLEAENEKLRSEIDSAHETIRRLQECVDADREAKALLETKLQVQREDHARQNEKLREALRQHGRHDKNCRMHPDYPYNDDLKCDCGLAKALEEK